MSNRGGGLIAGRVRDRDELDVFASVILRRMFLRVLVTRRSVGLRQAVSDALQACAENREE